MAKGSEILSYAVRVKVVAHLIGLLCWTLAPLTAPPIIVALINGDRLFATRLGVIFVFLLVAGFMAWRKKIETPRLNEVMAVSALTFTVPPLFMGWALTAFGIDWPSAIFEAVSGLTTTGLSVLKPEELQPNTLLFTRAWMQWFGGFGFAVLALGLRSGAGTAAARRLGESGEVANDPVGSLRERARRMLIVYAGLTALCFIALWLSGASAWHSLLLSLTALATGGFSYDSASAAALASPVSQAVLIGFAALGAVSFSVYLYVWRRQRPDSLLRTDVLALGVFIVLAIAGLFALILADGGYAPGEALGIAAFTGLSAQTNTGYSIAETASLPGGALVWLMIAMAIGGNSGSTAGGIKTFRALAVLATIRLTLQRTSLPDRAATRLKVDGHTVEQRELENIAAVIFLAVATVLFSWIIFQAYGYGADALFDIVSAVTTTGLSTGVVGPALEPGLKYALAAAMLLGRVEFIALLVLVWPGTWFGQRYVS